MNQITSLLKSFGYAFEGVKSAFKSESNFRIHTLIAVTAILAAFYLGFTKLEWIILTFTIAFVLILEMINTSIEKIVDMVSPEVRHEAKVAKDVAAASVLISTVLSVIVGVALFLPYFTR